jgi:excisionase family DNA binding protein
MLRLPDWLDFSLTKLPDKSFQRPPKTRLKTIQRFPPNQNSALEVKMVEQGSNTPTRLLKPEEAARFLSISTRTLNRWVDQGVIPVIKLGGSRRFWMEDLMATIDKNRSCGNV